MFRLFQLDVPRHQFDAVNEMGWAEAMEKFPRVEAHMALTMRGSEAYVTEYDPFFKHVADIEATDLENAFFVHNNPFGDEALEEQITRYGKQHSMSVGDIVVGEHGDVHMVDPEGFTQLMSSFVGSDVEAA